jgi:hypothetical protein
VAEHVRVAVLFEPGRNGAAALDAASEWAATSGAEMTVVVLAPQVSASRGCVPSPTALNCAILDTASLELREAAQMVPDLPLNVRYRVLVEHADPPLRKWVEAEQFDVVMLPARRRPFAPVAPRHPAVRKLRRIAGCDVRVVADRGQRAERS